MKLRHLDLQFGTYSYLTIPGDDIIWDTKYNPDLRGRSSIISNALDFLSESHRLQSLVLRFQGSNWALARFSFWFSKDSEPYRCLTKFKAIEKLKCCVNTAGLFELDEARNAVYEEAVDNYYELSAKLAAGYVLESEGIASSSTKTGLQSDPIS